MLAGAACAAERGKTVATIAAAINAVTGRTRRTR
jgi:hypothetical protein